MNREAAELAAARLGPRKMLRVEWLRGSGVWGFRVLGVKGVSRGPGV